MIGLDTNVLLRFILQDDRDQGARAAALLASLSPLEPGFIPSVTLAECFWVLDRSFRKPKAEIILLISGLLGSQELVLENQHAVTEALRMYEESNADFSDCLIERTCHLAGCARTMTFDLGASRDCGMVLV
jgi:predicted nucleic-acid-binding protein